MYLSLITICFMVSALVYPVHSRESLSANGAFAWEYDRCNTVLAILRICNPDGPINNAAPGGLPSSYQPPANRNPLTSLRPSSSGTPQRRFNPESEPHARQRQTLPRGNPPDDDDSLEADLSDSYAKRQLPSYGIEQFMDCDQMIQVTTAIKNAWKARRCSRKHQFVFTPRI